MRTVAIVTMCAVLVTGAIARLSVGVAWSEAARVIAEAEQRGVIGDGVHDRPLSIMEITVVQAEFRGTWDQRDAPCRTIWSVARALTASRPNTSGHAVSYALATLVIRETDWSERSVSRHLMRAAVSCQLERRFSDDHMLRMWLERAYFGQRLYGVSAASFALFDNEPDALDWPEAARVAALLWSPGLWHDAERWERRSQFITDQVAEYRMSTE